MKTPRSIANTISIINEQRKTHKFLTRLIKSIFILFYFFIFISLYIYGYCFVLTQFTTGGNKEADIATPIKGPLLPCNNATATPVPDGKAHNTPIQRDL